jgi:hypothetical protein
MLSMLSSFHFIHVMIALLLIWLRNRKISMTDLSTIEFGGTFVSPFSPHKRVGWLVITTTAHRMVSQHISAEYTFIHVYQWH